MENADPDKVLVEAAQRGDRKAAQRLIERHQRRVYGLCLGMLRNPDAARDATQEIFLKMFKNIGGFSGTSSFSSWLLRIANNQCIDAIRRRKTNAAEGPAFDESRGVDDDLEGPEQLASGQSLEPLALLQRKELAGRIHAALATLSERHRSIFILREIDGLSYEELAEVLEVPVGTVMSRLYHARAKLQAALGVSPDEAEVPRKAS